MVIVWSPPFFPPPPTPFTHPGLFLFLSTSMNEEIYESIMLIRGTPTVDFETFSKMLNRPGGFRDPGEPEEYCRGFQVFDKDMTGFIGVGQLRYILTNLGEKMSDDEVDELLKAVDTSSGEINYTGMFMLRTGIGFSGSIDEDGWRGIDRGTWANMGIDLVRTILAN